MAAVKRNDAATSRQRMIEHLDDATGLLVRSAAKQKETRLLKRVSRLAR